MAAKKKASKKTAGNKKAAPEKAVTETAAPKKAAAKKAPPKKAFEEALWDTANKLRGKVESSEYKHIVLSLIFLKFASDRFEARRAELIAEGQTDYVDMVEFYTMKNVFLPLKNLVEEALPLRLIG